MCNISATHSTPWPASFDPAMAQHDGLVQFVVRRQWGGNLPFAERLQAGRIGLWQALRHFDPQQGTAFSTYAYPAIAHAVWQAVAQAQPPPEYLAADPPRPAPDDDERLLRQEVAACLHQMVEQLPAPLRQVVILYYGLQGQPPLSLRQLAPLLGLSHEMVRQRLLAALVYLRHPPHSLRLRQLLDRNTVADYEAADELAQRYLRQRGGRHGR